MSDVKSLTANVNNLTSSNISVAAKILLSLSETDPNKANVRIGLRFEKMFNFNDENSALTTKIPCCDFCWKHKRVCIG